MDRTRNLKLKYIVASQAQKEVTINEDLNVLDMLVQATAKGIANTPPESPAEGDMYIIGDAPAGAWEGKAKHLAGFFAGVWLIVAPRDGWRVWLDEGKAMRYQGGAWADEGVLTLSIVKLNSNGYIEQGKRDTGDAISGNGGANVNIASWFGLGFYSTYKQKYTGSMDLRSGNWRTTGAMRADGGFEGTLRGTADNANQLGGKTLDQLLAEVDRRIAAKHP